MLAVGNEAKNMVGRVPGNVISVRPLRDEVVQLFHDEAMLQYFMKGSIKVFDVSLK